jgi:serine/threonine protein kinase/tetratricopeptide (TPR) repeat protein
MDAQQWQRVKELFSFALERAPSERAGFVAQACIGDEEVREQVESLLAEHEELAVPAVGEGKAGSAEQVSASDAACSGRRIGAYRLLRRLGQGGMATVYLAVRADDQYKKYVAVKMIPAGLDNESLLRRFRNERQTLAALDHPNIVKLLDAGTSEDGLPFLVMDYVEGTRLDRYCDHHRLSIRERLELFCKVCDAVSYAHQRLIIHRDLKPSNILVTAEGTPKLLDFGIAKLMIPETAATLLVTATGQRAMTPGYASPEQVRGEPMTNATDVYSLGVILYELLSGHNLYELESHNMAEIEHAICEEEPIKPSDVVSRGLRQQLPDGTTTTSTAEEISSVRLVDPKTLRGQLHGDLDAIVMTALRKEPQRRYASVHEFSQDIRQYLNTLPIRARPSTVAYRATKFLQRHRKAAVLTSSFIAVALATGGVWYTKARPRVSTYRMIPTSARRSIAVLGFKNLSSRQDADWISTALSEMLRSELAAGARIRTIPGENVARMKIDLSLPDTDSLAQDTVAKIYRNLGSDLVVLGSYLDSAGTVRLDLHLQDAGTGEILKSFTEMGNENDLSGLVTKAGQELRQELGLTDVTPQEAAAIEASLPANPEATQFYAEGLSKLRVFDSLGAREALQKAVDHDPNSALAHSALAEGWANLGYDQKAKEEARTAVDLSKNLSHEERLLIEGRFREIARDWAKTLEIYQTLSDLFPDNIEYGLRLASAQRSAGKEAQALSTIAVLRRLPLPMRDDPRIDLAEAKVYHWSSDYKHEEITAESAERKARAEGSKLLLARALLDKASGEQGQDRFADATVAFESAKRILEQAGDRSGAAFAALRIGEILANQGDLSQAKSMEEESLTTFRKIGDEKDEAAALLDIAVILYEQGDLNAAREEDEEALQIFRAVSERAKEALTANNMGVLFRAQGNLSKAEAAYRLSLTLSKEVSERYVTVLALGNLGDTLLERGDLPGAKSAYEESLHTAEETGDRRDAAYARRGLGSVLLNEGDLPNARKKYEAALQLENTIRERNEAALTHVFLAAVAIEENRLADAESLAQTALDEFSQEHDQADEILASATLARSLVAQGKIAEAKTVIDDSRSLIAKDFSVLLAFTVAQAEVEASEGKPMEALAILGKRVSQVQRHGFFLSGLEGQLVIAQIEMKSHRTASGVAHLRAVAKEAEAKGFLLMARKASTAAKSKA